MSKFPYFAVLLAALVLTATGSAARADQGFVGMQIQDMPPEVFQALGEDRVFGLLVRDVGLGTPAARSGFLRGDILTAIDGESMTSIQQVVSVLKDRSPGDSVEFDLLRGGEEMTLRLDLGSWPEHWRHGHTGFAAIPALGITLATVNDQIQQQMGVRWSARGVVVTIVDETKQALSGLKRGDVILQVNQQTVWLPKQVLDLYEKAKAEGRPNLLIFVERPAGYEYRLLPVN